MSAAAIWAVAGLLLGALEMVAPGVFLLWIGVGAIGTGVATQLFNLDGHAQTIVFIVLTAALIGGAALRLRRSRPQVLVNTPAGSMIGQTCRVIDFRDGEGRVALGDGTWLARLQGGVAQGSQQPTPGAALKIVGLEGTTLLVVANG